MTTKALATTTTTTRTLDVLNECGTKFSDLLLPETILRGLEDSGFYEPSPIQLRAIPIARFGCDLIAQAKSGTGKTVVFATVILNVLKLDLREPQALVIAPTREIATQIANVIGRIGRHLSPALCVVTLIGGLSRSSDRKRLGRGCHVAIGTPGRVADLIRRKILSLKKIKMYVVDEADQLHDGAYDEEMINIAESLPSRKQVMAFSATFTDELLDVVREYMRNPQEVRISKNIATCEEDRDEVALRGIVQYRVVEASSSSSSSSSPSPSSSRAVSHIFRSKSKILESLLRRVRFRQCVVFCNDRDRASNLAQRFHRKGWPCQYISGNQKQYVRNDVIRNFRDFRTRILMTTDLTSRGVDFSGVDLVVNMDIPADSATYLHRIGRAGRFGTRGTAVTILVKGEVPNFNALERKINVPIVEMPDSYTGVVSCNGDGGEEDVEEYRIDRSNGRQYTKAEFVSFYGGLEEWNHARRMGEKKVGVSNVKRSQKQKKKTNEREDGCCTLYERWVQKYCPGIVDVSDMS
ncbi:DEAD/DEAH box helicase [bacterium]|nr:DEAD/DEAH box helicase [bacterium]